jgi:RND family efflux transporter MFP subunit
MTRTDGQANRRWRGPVLTVVAAAAALALLGAAGCGKKQTTEADEGADASNAKAEVTLTHVTRKDISQTLALSGTAAALPNHDVRVSSLVAGRVESMRVAEGDRVQAGELLAKLDDRSYRDQLQQAEAGQAQAKANLENAKLTRARNEDLFQRGIAARKDLEDSRTQESVAAAALRQAEAALSLARMQVSRTEIRSPLNGQVVKRFVSDGEQVDGTAAQPIVEVANLSELEFLANPAAMYLGKMHRGQPVQVTSEALAGKTFAGRIVAISPSVDPNTGVGVARIRVPNAGGSLRIGLFLNAQIPIETHKQALTAPPSAVYHDENGRTEVYLVNGDSATAVSVKVGIETQEKVELLPGDEGGVKEGDTIILTGGYGLGEKAKIQVKGEAKSSKLGSGSTQAL